MCDDLLIEGSVATELLEGYYCVEITHVVGVICYSVLYVVEKFCFLLDGGNGVHSSPQFLISLVEVVIDGVLTAETADRHEL